MTLLGGAAMSWPLAARAQQGVKVYRVGFLWDSPAVFAEAIEAFQHGLREQGWIDGRIAATIAIAAETGVALSKPPATMS
jgi:hypothetical protein